MSEIYRWAPPPLPPRASRAQRRQHHVEAADTRHRLRNIWREFWSDLSVVNTDRYTPTSVLGWTEPPRIGRITLGPPTTHFTVELRAGLCTRDVELLRSRLAQAYEVDGIMIRDLPGRWIAIVLVELTDDVAAGDEALPSPTSTSAGESPTRGRVLHRLSRWQWRGRSGRPRSWR